MANESTRPDILKISFPGRETPIPPHAGALYALMLSASLLAACDKKEGPPPPATQVAARVNTGEISIHQVNRLLKQTAGLSPEQAGDARRQILDNLVDQELAVQQALAAKLDRNPAVMQNLEAARRDVLARAYLEQAAAGKAPPGAAEVQAYYREHPELFAERKIYRLQEIVFTAPPETIAAVRAQLPKVKSSAELLAALKGRGIKATAAIGVKPAENIALDLLPRLAPLKPGESLLFEKGNRAAIVTVVASTPEAIGEERARPFIEQYLKRRQSSEQIRTTLQQLRQEAKIEYVGEFGKEAAQARRQKEAEAARQAKEAQEAREAARLAQEAEAARRAEESRKTREEAQAARERARAPAGRLPPPSDGVIGRGLSGL